MTEEMNTVDITLTERMTDEQDVDAQATNKTTQVVSTDFMNTDNKNCMNTKEQKSTRGADTNQQTNTICVGNSSDTGNGQMQPKQDVAALNCKMLNETIAKLQDANIVIEHFTCTTCKNLEDVGIHWAYSKFNRPVNKRHIAELKKALGNANTFTAFALACPAIVAVKGGAELYDEESKPLTADTPNLETYLLILDGQHRLLASKESGKGLKVLIIPCPDNPDKMIYELNRTSRNWSVSDQRNLLAHQKNTIDQLQEATEKAKLILPGCSEKFYAYALTGKVDAIRKSEVERGLLPKYNKTEGEIGENILCGLAFIPNKKSWNIRTLKSIFNVKSVLGAKHTGEEFGNAMKYVLSNAKESELTQLSNYIREGKLEEFEKELSTMLTNFLNSHKDIDQHLMDESSKKAQQKSLQLVEEYRKTHKSQNILIYKQAKE